MCLSSSYLESGKLNTNPSTNMNLEINRPILVEPQSFILDSIFELSNPYSELSYLRAYPYDLIYPSFVHDLTFTEQPFSRNVPLPCFSDLVGASVFTTVRADYVVNESPFNFIRQLDQAMCGVDDLTLTGYPLCQIGGVLLEQYNELSDDNIMSPYCYYDDNFESQLKLVAQRKYDQVLWPSCYVPEITPTFTESLSSLGKGIAGTAYGAYHLTQLSESQMSQILTRWTLDVAILATNFNIHTFILSFVKILNELFNLPNLLQNIYDIFLETLKSFGETASNYFSTQPLTEIQPTSYDGIVESLTQYKSSLPVIASSCSAIAVIFASLIVGKESFDSFKSASITDRVAHAMHAVAKGKAGIYACLAMIKDFKNFINDIILDLLSGSGDDVLLKLIATTTVLDQPGKEADASLCQKYHIFDYIKYLVDDNNRLHVCSSTGWKNRLDFSIRVLTEVSYNIANGNCNVPPQTTHFVVNTLRELQRVRTAVARNPNPAPHRFTPFWINIVGKSGLGKSQISTLMFEYFYDVLSTIGKFQIPEKSQFAYSVNFADKYMTNYKQQYLVYVDDYAQDNNVPEINSDLLLINLVSNTPYSTVQAAVEDKGISFTSKIVLTTSNDFSLKNRKSIADCDALKRRMQCYAELIENPFYEKEPLMNNKRVMFHVKDRLTLETLGVLNAKEFIKHAILEYGKWFDHEMSIAANKKSDPALVEEIKSQLVPTFGPFEVLQQATSNTVNSIGNCWKNTVCKLNLVPIRIMENRGILLQQFDCRCPHHVNINDAYYGFYMNCPIDGPVTLKDFLSARSDLVRYRDEFTTRFSDIAHKAIEYLKSPLVIAFLGACAVLAAYMTTKTLRANHETVEDEEDFIEGSAAQYSLSKPKRARLRKVNIVATDGPLQPIHRADSVAADLVQNTLFKKGSLCVIQYGEKGACATRIRGTVFLTNHHFMCMMNEGDVFTVHIPNVTGITEVKQCFASSNMYRIPDTDLVLYKCDRSMQACKDIVKHFLGDDLVNKPYQAAIVTAYHGYQISDNLIARPNTHADGSVQTYHSLDKSHCYDVIDTWTVSTTLAPIERGMSGSLLIATDNSMTHKIIGVQMALNTVHGKGYFKPVTIKWLEAGLSTLNVKDELSPPTDSISATCGVVFDADRCPPNLGYTSLKYLGVLANKSKTLKVSTTSKIVPSLVHDESSLTQLPSVLDDHDQRMKEELIGKSVMFRAMEGFDRAIGAVHLPTLSRALDDLKVEYRVRLTHPVLERNLLDDYQVVNGIPTLINRIEMKSSPGYPYVLQRKETNKGGKYEWFKETTPIGAHTIAYAMKEDLARGMKQREELAKKGIRSPTIAYACLKDETRPLGKIQDGATRAFICLPLDYNLLIRKYFGAFIAMQHYKAGEISSCVGIDPAKQWKEIYDRLMSKNPLWEDFDYKHWDQSLHPELVMSVATLVNYWYGDSDESEAGTVRRTLLTELVHTHIIVKDRLFMKSSGQCSGCAITAELNCLVHELLVYYIWLQIHKRDNLETSLSDFRENVCIMLYGDDIIKSVRDTCSIQFNGDAIKPYVSQLGMNITPGNKTDTVFKLKRPEEITFLKRSFRKDGDMIKAPLRPDIVENIIQWIHKSDDNCAATQVNCETALQESYMHGLPYYNSLYRKINDRILDYNNTHPFAEMQPVVMGYEHFDGKYIGQTYICSGLNKPALV